MKKRTSFLLLGCIIICSLFMVSISQNISTKRKGIQLNLSYDRGTEELIFDEEETSISISSTGDNYTFSVEIPEGLIYVRARYESQYDDFDFSMKLFKSSSFNESFEESDESAGVNELIEYESDSEEIIYIQITRDNGWGYIALLVTDSNPMILPILLPILLITLLALLIVVQFFVIKRSKEKIEKVDKQHKINQPAEKVYPYLLNYYSKLSNLNITNMVENKSIETETRQTRIGTMTTTHRTSSGSTYHTSRPYTYVVRYNSKVKLEKEGGRTKLKLKLHVGKRIFLNSYIFTIMMIVMGLFMLIIFSIFLSDIGIGYVSYIYFAMMLIGPGIGILIAFNLPKSYMRTAEDTFQLLVKKPMIQMEMEKKGIQVEVKSITPSKATPPEKLFCPYCGKVNDPSAKICEDCGETID